MSSSLSATNKKVQTFSQSAKLDNFLASKTYEEKTVLLGRVSAYCRAPETLACLANADIQSLVISTDAIEAICNNIKGNGKEKRAEKLNALINGLVGNGKTEYEAQQEAIKALFAEMANWISAQANLYFTIKDDNAALECARLWHNEKDFCPLDRNEIKAAFGLAAKSGKQNYHSFSVVFFCTVIQEYLKAREIVKRILSDLEGKDEKEKVLAIGQGDVVARKNAQAVENRKTLFLQEVEQRKVLQTLHISKGETLKMLKEKSLLIPENLLDTTKQISEKCHLELLRYFLSQRIILATNPYQSKKNKVAIALTVVMMWKKGLISETSDVLPALIELLGKPLAEFVETIGDNKEFVAGAEELVQSKFKGYLVDAWYQYAVETCDLQQLILLGF